jgi:ATP-dependent helicase/nuclease subunit A
MTSTQENFSFPPSPPTPSPLSSPTVNEHLPPPTSHLSPNSPIPSLPLCSNSPAKPISPSDLRSPNSELRPLSHQAISASAGSGKTFRLAHRYIRLLADGVHPDRICALTFSRKAAGEIFDSVVSYLCQATDNPKKAKETAEHIGRHDMDCLQFGLLLRAFLDSLHRMHIGTLDSFMIGVAKAFPSELGIPSEFQVMDNGGAMATDMRESILANIFDPRIASDDVQRRFIEAFKQATFGQDEKTLGDRLSRFIEDNREHFLLAPSATLWGQPDTIGLSKREWLFRKEDPQELAKALREAIQAAAPSASVCKRFNTFADICENVHPGTPWPKEIEYLFNRLAPEMPALLRGEASVKIVRETFEMPPAVCRAALHLLQHVIRCEIESALKRTNGLFEILALYDAHYGEHIRQTGQMTFNDAQVLLTDSNPASGGALISREANTPGKLYIDYRLDCKLDHWLLDEFQDTSDLQWAVLRNLADEILQDDSGTRSFFYVGDVKQAIYAWRGGNAQLFGRILKHYGERIECLPMNVSFRSCPPIIETVNTIFENVSEADGLQAQAADSWNQIWEHHESAQHLQTETGYTALLEPVTPAYGNRFTSSDRYDVVAAILNDMQPIKRGIDIAVLVTSNKAGYEIVDHLRRRCPDVPIVHEGSTTILDNPVVALLLSLLRVASHPGDRFAWQHIQMSPLRHSPSVGASPSGLSLTILSYLHLHGFQSTTQHWATLLEAQSPLDDFGHSRLQNLLEAAASFDETGSRDIDAFIRYAEAHQVQELSAAQAVRVMTVHQSKGLGFDVVIFPELQGRSMTTAGALSLTTATVPETGKPRWVLDMPRRSISIETPELAEQVEQIDNETSFNALCALYVALTRAKQALYMVTNNPGKTSTSQNAAAFIKARLKGDPNPPQGEAFTLADHPCARLHECGNRDWFNTQTKTETERAEQEAPTLPDNYNTQPSIRTQLERIEPSTEKEIITSAALLFKPEMRDVLDFGSAIHALFEAVEWIEDMDVEAVIQDWLKRSTDGELVKRDVCTQFRNAVMVPAVRSALAQPAGTSELWREKRFEVILESQWVTGIFDRVTIIKDKKGTPQSATILDYKSNRVETPEKLKETTETYRPQLDLYQRALSHILRIPKAAITKQLLFTRTGTIATL